MSTAATAGRGKGFRARTFDHPRWDQWRNRRSRVRISMTQAAAGCVLVMATAYAVSADLPAWLYVPVLGIPLVLWVGATGALNASINGMTELSSRDLDEVQRRVRDIAYRRAYRIAVVLVAGLAGLIIAGALSATTAVQETLIGYGAFLFVLMLPGHLLAWTLPDD